jgi:hypothetical protein
MSQGPAPATSLLALFAERRLTAEDLTVTVPREARQLRRIVGGIAGR